jgi:hypothetical protein
LGNLLWAFNAIIKTLVRLEGYIVDIHRKTKPISMISANITFAIIQWMIVAFILGSLFGFAFRSKKILKLKKRVFELEIEMVENHAEILLLHRDNSINSGNAAKVPVINLPVSDQANSIDKIKAKG